MEDNKHDKLSVFISLILRHKPDTIGISLDEHGWADVDELVDGINGSGRRIDMDILEEIVRTDKKGRYSFSPDKTLIRANQGHSIPVDVGLKEQRPPRLLYHGTAERFIPSIMEDGLKPMSRLYVHLSKNIETAERVGRRHGSPRVLRVRAEEMWEKGNAFYLSENGVWLTKAVMPEYLEG